MHRLPRIAALFVGMALLLAAAPVPASADGVAAFPNRIQIENGLRGGQYERTVTFENDFEEEGVFELAPQGAIADWIEIRNQDGEPVTEVAVEAGGRVSVTVAIVVPGDAENNFYEGSVGALLIVGQEDTAEGTGSGVRLGVVIPLTIDVTGEQIIQGTFLELIVGDGEVGLPHRITAVVLNAGNVALRPDVSFEVLAGSEVIDSLQPSLDLVAPGDQTQLRFDWDTSTQRPGDYVARVGIAIGELDLGTLERPFTLAPRGTLTRSGVLQTLQLVGDVPVPGGVARIEASFANTGQIESRAELVGELFLDGVLIGAPGNPPTLVQPGEVETLELFIETEEAGSYSLIARVNFEGVETEALTLEFVVAEPVVSTTSAGDADEGSPLTLVIVLAAVGILLVGAGALLWWRRRSDAAPAWRAASSDLPAHDQPDRLRREGEVAGATAADAAGFTADVETDAD